MATGTIILPIQAAKLPSTSAPSGDSVQNIWRLLFDPNTTESCEWQFRMPLNYSSSPVTKLQYCMVSPAASGQTVEFEASVMAVTDGDNQIISGDSFDTINTGSATIPVTNGNLDEISITMSNTDSLTAGDFVRFKLARDADDVTNDTASGDAAVVALSLEYTTS